ncbi:sialidase family protein [Kribbella sp. NPDC003505]|uniref:sialidase family protein n=1 Tax=Kribbella sp. NPDC003505 TaxID=3154448 RepID=UPI0033B3922A
MGRPRLIIASVAAFAAALCGAAVAAYAAPATEVTVGSPPTPFSQNKQNEPAVAIDAHDPAVLAAGVNDEIDMESCAAGDPSTCPFTDGVGVSGVYFSFDSGQSWTQPTYTGWTARHCLGPAVCVPRVGPIGTLPHYYEAGLVSDGDPAVAFGPRPGPNGTFSWANGSRLYYANLTSNFSANRRLETFRGVEAIAVSTTDDVRAAAAGNASAWTAPVIISRQSSTTFSDKEQIYADNAASSRFFGHVYTCWSSFRSNSHGNALPIPLTVARSADGGRTWITKQVGPASSNGVNQQADGCVVRTDSTGNVYVFGVGARSGTNFQLMYKSTDGGAHWSGPTLVAPVVKPGVFDPVEGRPVMDGIAGARVDLAGGPNVDIANGRPTGAGATDELFMTWSDGRAGLNHEQLMLTWSARGGTSWVTPAPLALTAGDRPVYTAPAVSPDGSDLYIVHNSFTTPYRANTTDPRGLVGEVRHANVSGGVPSGWTTLERVPGGDPRGSSANALISEFLGDYVYAAATNDRAVAVWNDAHEAGVCASINAYRASLYTTSPLPAPNVLATCPATFGNTDILGGSYPDPTP